MIKCQIIEEDEKLFADAKLFHEHKASWQGPSHGPEGQITFNRAIMVAEVHSTFWERTNRAQTGAKSLSERMKQL